MALVRIPGGIELEHFKDIRNIQREILTDLEIRRTGARRVATRLNNSDRENPSPHFVGIVEDRDMKSRREQRNEPDPGLFRFGDDNSSVVYTGTFSDPLGGIKTRDWDRDFDEKTSGAKALAVESGVKYQMSIAIRVPEREKPRSVGILTVGFYKKPEDPEMEKVRSRLNFYAQDPESPLIKYLINTFHLGGRTF